MNFSIKTRSSPNDALASALARPKPSATSEVECAIRIPLPPPPALGLTKIGKPILRAAGLEKQNIQMVIINQGVFNAFVADGRRIFVNYGAILQSETPNQIIGVMAHETGHLAGGPVRGRSRRVCGARVRRGRGGLTGERAAAAPGPAGRRG